MRERTPFPGKKKEPQRTQPDEFDPQQIDDYRRYEEEQRDRRPDNYAPLSPPSLPHERPEIEDDGYQRPRYERYEVDITGDDTEEEKPRGENDEPPRGIWEWGS